MSGSSSPKFNDLVRNFFFSSVNKEFLIFLFFLLLSGAFWMITTLNETYERELLIPMHLSGVPQNVVITSGGDDTLRVTVRDKGYTLLAYLYGNRQPIADISFKTYSKNGGVGNVSTQELQKLIYLELYKSTRITSIKPDRLSFTYNHGDSKRVPVRMYGKVTPGQSYYLARVKFTPETIQVYSDPARLDSIKEVYTETQNITNLTDTLVRTVSLQKLYGVKCVPATVQMALYPDVLTEESVEVPIVAENMPEGKVLRTFPSRVKVVFVAGASMFRNIRSEQFRVVVDYADILAHPSDKCNLILKAVPNGVRNARPDPVQVDYLIEQQ